ncbi:MAG TPA: M14 family zinc carboxypeptidase [Gemmatirosa sp.]
MARRLLRPAVVALAATAASVAGAQPTQPLDSAYTAQIRALTPTDPHWKFTTELVDHLPASATVPTPLKALGYVPGTVGRLSKVAEINAYFRAVAAASPRVKVFSLGMSEEGREMLIVAVADSATIARLDDYRAMAGRLADPRGLADAERARLVREAKPIYWLTGSIHSPETGSPEMLMELVYRLAVSEAPNVRRIRDGVITLITPVTETDGRDRAVDAYALERQLKVGRGGVPLVYWGKYVAHDNNRDGLVLSLKLSQHINDGGLHWHPTVLHDLHESVPFLYASTGTGPYNDEFDPIVVDEWHTLAYQEITELTKRGLPGVWTHGFYDGWAPNYMFGIAQFHNAIGRFYETYTSMGADCHIVHLPAAAVSREWDRPSPPVNGVKWCIRSNINYQQSGVLVALDYVARNRETFLDNFALKARRMIDRGRTTAPYAFVIPRGQRRAAEAADLVNYFRRTGTEVQVATGDYAVRTMPAVIERAAVPGPNASGSSARGAAGGRVGTDSARGGRADSAAARPTVPVHAGDWIVRMDQPYTALPRTVLAVQRYRADDPPPYDDTGWSLDRLRHVTVYTVDDSTVLARPMQLLTTDARVAGTVAGAGATLAVPPLGDWRSATLPWAVGGARVMVADTAFAAGRATFPAGTALVANTPDVRAAVERLGLAATALGAAPTVRSHAVTLPRIAFVHTWLETQNEGWLRHALDEIGVPFTYVSTQRLVDPHFLDRFDVVLFPHATGTSAQLVNGRPMVGPPIPWRRSATTPSFAGTPDSTDDLRPGMGYEGVAALRHFVERGGLLITEGNSARLPVDMGFNPTVSVVATPRLVARGAVYRAQAVERMHPVLYGYEAGSMPVYFNQAPVFAVQADENAAADARSRAVMQNVADTAITGETERQRARVVLRFDPNADSLLVSGQLENGAELAGKAAVVDAPLGRGHVLLFGIRPMWRYETQGSYAMVLNALAHWNALDVNRRPGAVAERAGPATAPGEAGRDAGHGDAGLGGQSDAGHDSGAGVAH